MKTYLITGASQGLGRNLSLALATDNNKLILLDKDLITLNKLYDELENNNCEIILLPMDLLGANLDDYHKVKVNLLAEFKQLNAVFLNAAILPSCTPIEHFDSKQWYEVIHTNLNANFHLIQMCLELLCKTKNAKLIAMLDKNIKDQPAYYGAYAVAKAGL
jgi:NAD(P)-dependent dehydrogenase (short-subunit alcohol dehydrogenase family)